MTQRNLQENGAAEMVGVLMLIAVFVAVIAIIAVMLFSQPAPEKLPAVAMTITNQSKLIVLSNNGGNNLLLTDMAIRVDDQLVPTPLVCPGCSDGYWSIGDTITIDCTVSGNCPGQNPNKVDIIYKKAGKDYRLLATQYLWTMTPTQTQGTPSPTTAIPTTTVPTPPAPLVAFTVNVTSGTASLPVLFADKSTNFPTSWSWDFGDGTISTEQNPVHTYTTAGTYTVSLTATNAGGSNTLSKTGYITVSASAANFVFSQNVFVWGNKLSFAGDHLNGPGATVFLTGPLSVSTINGGGALAVSTIYVDGDVDFSSANGQSLGSPTRPGNINITGNLNIGSGMGTGDIYGNVYVAKSLSLSGGHVHGNMYVNGDVYLGNTPALDTNSYIYYTGTLTTVPNFNHPEIVIKCVKVTSVSPVTIPSQTIPSLKSAVWYTNQGYVSSGTLKDNLKIFANSYTSTSWGSSANNVVIVASNGDITLTQGYGSITGVLYAPNGKVTFDGGSFTGVVIASNGFSSTHGGTTITFTNYFSDPNDYPFT